MIKFLLAFLVIMLIQAALNEIRFGSPFDFGLGVWQDITTHNHIEGVIGYIFSMGWGIFFNAPIMILLPLSLYLLFSSQNKDKKALGFLVLSLFVITWIFFGTMKDPHWSGYGGWGPRYFTTVLPLLVISIGFAIQKFSKSTLFKSSFLGLAVFGFFVGLMGKLVWYFYAYGYGWTVLRFHKLENWFEVLNYDINYAPITLHVKTLLTNFIPDGIPTQNIDHARGLAPCPYDFFIYCEIGIGPFIGILLAFAFVGYLLILKNIPKMTSREIL